MAAGIKTRTTKKILRFFVIFRNKFQKQNKLYFISLLARSIKYGNLFNLPLQKILGQHA